MTLIELPDEENRSGLGRYRKLIEDCEECDGVGDFLVETDDEDEVRIVACDCKKQAIYLYRLDRANVQKRYRDFDLRNLRKEFREDEDNQLGLKIVKAYCRDLDEHLDEGHGIFFCGPSGVAKSTIANYIVRRACEKGRVAYVDRLAKLVQLRLAFRDDDKQEHLEWVLGDEVELLAIEEVDKVRQHLNSSPSGLLFSEALQEIMGAIYDSEKSLLVTSNLPLESREHIDDQTGKDVVLDGLDRIFEPHIIDRFQALQPCLLVGESFRPQQRWYKE